MNAAAETIPEITTPAAATATDIAARRKAGKRVLGDEADPGSPAALIRYAIETGADVEKLERLYALKRQYDADESRKSFVLAMSEFKSEPLIIEKRKFVGYDTKEGDKVGYWHAELAGVTEIVCPAMAKHRLSHRWDVRQENGRVIVTCIVTHADGHSETCQMDGAPDASGKKNPIQQVASTVTFLQRYTLMSLCGVAARGADDDGRGADNRENPAGAEEDPAVPIANALYDKISLADSGAELQSIKEEIKAAKVPDNVRRNLAASYNARRKVLAGEVPAPAAAAAASSSQPESAQ
jgi:hypothetical protein